MRTAVASSADTPFAEKVGRKAWMITVVDECKRLLEGLQSNMGCSTPNKVPVYICEVCAT